MTFISPLDSNDIFQLYCTFLLCHYTSQVSCASQVMAFHSFGYQIVGIGSCYEAFRMKLQWECYRVKLGLALMPLSFTERSKLHTKYLAG